MKTLLLCLMVISFQVQAVETKKSANVMKSNRAKTTSDTTGTLDVDPKSAKEGVTEDTALVMKPENVKVDINCKARDGHEIKQGEAGYEDCLKKVKSSKHNPDADLKVDFKK